MDKVTELKRDKAELIDEQQEIVDKAEKEGRNLTNSEEVRWEKLDEEIDEIEEEISEIKKEREKDKEAIREELNTGGNNNMNRQTKIYTKENLNEFRSDMKQSGNIDPTMLPKDRDLSAGKAIRGLITGDWTGAEEERDILTTAPDSAGGYTVPAEVSADIISKAFNESAVMAAGASAFPMETKEVTVPKVTEGPTAVFKEEAASFDFDDMTFAGVDLEAKSLFAGVKMSIELAEDGQNIEEEVENTLAEAIAQKMDHAALYGTGGDAPTGLAETADVQEIESTTDLDSLDNYDHFSQAVQNIAEENGTAQAALLDPVVWGNLDRLKDNDNQPLTPPESYQELSKYVTNQVESDEIFVGDFSQILWGTRTDLRIEVSREAKDAFEKGLVLVRAYLRGDIAVARPEWFVHITEEQ